MSGIYFKADKSYGGKLRFDEGIGFVLSPRASNAQELLPLAEVERLSPLQLPVWLRCLKSPIAGFVLGFALGGITGVWSNSPQGFLGSGLPIGVAFAAIGWVMQKFFGSQLLLVEAKGRAAFRIHLPAEEANQIQAQHAQWFV